MTPAQRVDEWVKEEMQHWSNAHSFDGSDAESDLIEKYILIDGLKALPRIIEIIDEYDPVKFLKNKGGRAERFQKAHFLLSSFDNTSVRLRASEEGRRSIEALERAAERMRAAGYAVKKDGYDWYNGMFNGVVREINDYKGVNNNDDTIQDTFRFEYKIILSDAELLEFSNYLTARYPEYPSWSKGKSVKDDTEISPAGFPVINTMLEKPERYYEAYLEFKKTK